MTNSIVITGAREHNLKDISLVLPRDKLIVITGLSGSGKSSLAFDTIFAEGQRRYVESLSAYARQFLGQMGKPDVDSIEGLCPAVSIDQRTASRNPRSTVGTVTEIYDYLRLLYSRIGQQHCPKCGRALQGQSVQQIVDHILQIPPGSHFSVSAPVVRARRGAFKDLVKHLSAEGFTRVNIDGKTVRLDDPDALDRKRRHDISVVVDRLELKEGLRRRLTDSVETAAQLSDGLVEVEIVGGPSMMFSKRLACVDCGFGIPELLARDFSFNSPYGACPVCRGLGFCEDVDPDLIVPDGSRSISQGAILPSGSLANNAYLEQFVQAITEKYGVDPATPWAMLPERQRNLYLYGIGSDRLRMTFHTHEGELQHYSARWSGVVGYMRRRMADSKSDSELQKIGAYIRRSSCPECKGARLKQSSLAVTVGGMNIHQFTLMSVRESLDALVNFELGATERVIAEPVIDAVAERLRFLQDVGVGYLTLERSSATLSGGEAQRIRLATQIGSALAGVLYILDEPSVGLHQRDNLRLIETLVRLRDLGNTVIVVEHDEETIRAADYVVDMGPGAGEHGGYIVAEGAPETIVESRGSVTGDFLAGRRRIALPGRRRDHDRLLTVRGARMHNLRDIDVLFPVGAFTCVTGVSGSGKSTLVNEILFKGVAARLNRGVTPKPSFYDAIDGTEALDKVIDIDQSPIGRTPRSNPATYSGVFDQIRALFAATPDSRARGYKPGRFSFNVHGGRCEACKGDGQIRIQMHFLPDVYVPCEQCHGRRYNRDTLEVFYNGKNIAEILDMGVEEAAEFFDNVLPIKRRLITLTEVGLGYLKLGQPATTLSGGEAQRLKLATELSKVATGRTLYILDEPTTGLHFADVERLLEVLQRLVDQGNTVIVIEHNLDVIKVADYVIDLGPEGGEEGGRVIAAGTPEQLAECANISYTGHFLRHALHSRLENCEQPAAVAGSTLDE